MKFSVTPKAGTTRARAKLMDLIQRFVASVPYTDDGRELEFWSRIKKRLFAFT